MVIYLKERNFYMLKKDLILRNPLRLIGEDNEGILPEGGFGAVLARAGLGKTAILVQIALDSLLQSKNVLHISLADPVKKVCLWYEEVFRNIAQHYHAGTDDPQMWETILPHRLIMTFNSDSFSVPKLEERLSELTEQDIFLPQIILIDGLTFDKSVRDTLTDLKALATEYSVPIWFTVRVRREEETTTDNIPISFSRVCDLFEKAFQIQPREKKIHLVSVQGNFPSSEKRLLCLDPSTLLITED
jgi:hypothetical protein